MASFVNKIDTDLNKLYYQLKENRCLIFAKISLFFPYQSHKLNELKGKVDNL